ncbi:MAG: EamA family transporter [Actinobacteria bacterium]|nr:MAG: EamA family transporter [Actinomycetota bacterium]
MRLWAALTTIYVVWGSTYLAIRVMVETVPPLLGSGARFLVAGAIFAAVLVARRGASALRVSRRELASCAAVGTALLLGGNGLVAVAEQHVPSGLAALVVASVPLWVVVFRRASGEAIGAATALSVVAGFAGVAILLAPGERPGGAPVGGVLVVVAAAFCWASGSFASSRLPLPRDPLRSTAVQMLCGGALMLAVSLLAGEGGDVHWSQVSTASLLAFAYLVLAGSLAAFTAYVWLLRNAPVSQVATYAYVNPVIAIALGAVILGEQLTPLVLAGAGVIVASVAVTVRREGARPRARPATASATAPEPAR